MHNASEFYCTEWFEAVILGILQGYHIVVLAEIPGVARDSR
jgi:hypothetical protein